MSNKIGWVNCHCVKNNATKKVVINRDFGGFSLSEKAVIEIYKRKNNIDKVYIYKSITENNSCLGKIISYKKIDTIIDNFYENHYLSIENLGEEVLYDEEIKKKLKYLSAYSYNDNREDPDLIAVIEELGEEKCSGTYADLKIVEIPVDVKYTIENYDGLETIHEVHRVWPKE